MALGFFESSSDPSQPDSYETIQRKRKLVEAMMKQGMDTSPVQHWTQGLARLANAGVGAWKESELDKQEKDSGSQFNQKLLDAINGGGSSSSAPAPAPMGVNYASDGAPAPTPPADIPTSGTSPTKDAFVAQMMPHALKVAEATGLDPRVVVAQAALESGYGKSAPGGNYFGIKSHGAPGGQTLATNEVVNGQTIRTNDSFRKYDGGMGESAMGYAEFLKKNPRYAPMLQAQGMDAQIAALAKSGYATDPQYGAKIASIARSLPNPADLPSPGAREAGGAPFTPPQGMPEGFNPQPQAAQNPDVPSPGAVNAGPAQAPSPPTGGAMADDATFKSILESTAWRSANPRPGDTQIPLGPNGQLPPGAEKLLGALEGSPEARAMAPATGPQGQGAPVDKSKMLLMMAMDPRFSPQQRQMAMHVATTLQKDTPTWGKIGTDAMGREQMGWINPRTQKITPGPQMNGADSGGMVTVQGPNGPMQVPAAVAKQVQEALGKKMGGDLVGPDPEAAGKIRTEVQGLPGYKNLAQAAPIYQSMLKTAGTDSKASDLNLVYGLGKIFDPGSVVREGEMIMVKNTASLPDWLVGAANSLNGGQALTPETRKAIMAEAHNRVTSYQEQFINDADHYKGIASRQKMNVDDIINPNLLKPFEPWKAVAPPAAVQPPATAADNDAATRAKEELRKRGKL